MPCIVIRSVGTQCSDAQLCSIQPGPGCHPGSCWYTQRKWSAHAAVLPPIWSQVHSPQNESLTEKHRQSHHEMFFSIFKSNIDNLASFGTWEIWLCKDGNLTQIGNSKHNVKEAGTTLIIVLLCLYFTMSLQKPQYLKLNCLLNYLQSIFWWWNLMVILF